MEVSLTKFMNILFQIIINDSFKHEMVIYAYNNFTNQIIRCSEE